MTDILIYSSILLIVLNTINCEMRLQIFKNTDNVFIPVLTNVVEERVGSTFSLICELLAVNDEDDNLSWVKGEILSNFTRFKKTLQIRPGLNKSEKKFEPLRVEDMGNYYCISQKFNLTKTVSVKVIDSIKRNELRPMRETSYCNDHMFQCLSNGLCIIPHYVCDGKPDCKDGSDESLENCKGDPCKDKIPCDDGRCIPSSWCCDRHHDLNCSVTNRPKCCQSLILSESYEELEYGYPNINHGQHNGAKYLFISVCIVSILFSIVLLLLIVSKVVIFAKKTALQHQRPGLCENIALHNQTNINLIRANFTPTNIYTVRNNSRVPRSNITIESSDVNDPLLFNAVRLNIGMERGCDQPPSYVDAVRNKGLLNEPPPPYSSQEILNLHEEGQERS